MNQAIIDYIRDYVKKPSPVLDSVSLQHQSIPGALPHIEVETGSLLYSLILGTEARRVLELGTCLGYSSLWIGFALQKTGGRLLTIEKDERLYWQACQNIKEAGLEKVVELVCGDVREILPCLNQKYQLILQDSQKNLYRPLLETCINLLDTRGIIIADDTLLAVTNRYPSIRRAIDDYNKQVFSDVRLTSVILPVGDGLTISIKK